MSNKISKDIIIPNKENLMEIFKNLNGRSGSLHQKTISSAIAIFEMADKIQTALTLHFSRYQMTQARFIVLLNLISSNHQHHSPMELAEKIGVKPPTMTGILDGLVKEGFVDRNTDKEDRRKIIISLTPKGKKKIESMIPDHFDRVSRAFANWQTDKNKKQLQQITKKINKSLQILLEGIMQ